MAPTVYLWGLELPSYRVLTIVALLVGCGIVIAIAGRRGIPRRAAATIATAGVIGGLVGGRLLAAATATDPFWSGTDDVFAFRFGNMAMFGGLFGASSAVWLAARSLRVSVLRFGDAAAPGVAAGILLLRVGCLLAGCCFGRETTALWGITYPRGSDAHLDQVANADSPFGLMTVHAVHPIPVYEMLAAAALAIVSMAILHRDVRDGTAAAVVAAGYALARVVIEPMRASEPDWFYPHAFFIVFALAAAWLMLAAAQHLVPAGDEVDPIVLRVVGQDHAEVVAARTPRGDAGVGPKVYAAGNSREVGELPSVLGRGR